MDKPNIGTRYHLADLERLKDLDKVAPGYFFAGMVDGLIQQMKLHPKQVREVLSAAVQLCTSVERKKREAIEAELAHWGDD